MSPEGPAASTREWLVDKRVRNGLRRVERTLQESVASPDPVVHEVASHLLRQGGKRLRPALVLLAYGSAPFRRRSIDGAALVELLHLASLHHDDVMDRATHRRGGRSVNAHWGNELATLAGSFVFGKAGILASSLGSEVARMTGEAASRLCRGQLREAECAYDLEQSPDDHLETLRLKTATLFELASRLGAHLGSIEIKEAQRLLIYAGHLGLAFQLCDDVLDYTGVDTELGKETCHDLREGVYTLPILLALRRKDRVGDEVAAILSRREFQASDARETAQLVRESGTAAEALRLARRHAHLAIDALHALPRSPTKQSLEGITLLAVERVA